MKTLLTETELKNLISTVLDENQINEILKPTPKSEIELKTDKNGWQYKSVSASFIKKKMILIFGWDYDFEIKDFQLNQSTKETIVSCRLTVRNKGNIIVREQFGQHHLDFKSKDVGNGYKAACSDAFKKCCSELGICWDIYLCAPPISQNIPTSNNPDKLLERLDIFMQQCSSIEDLEVEYYKIFDNKEETEASTALLQQHINRISK